MKQALQFITLGVRDLKASKTWYIDNFGWEPFRDEGGIVFFEMNGFILSLYPCHELAEDIGVKDDGTGFRNFTLAILKKSEEEVDAVFEELKHKGVAIVKAPQKVFWGGYSGYVADPDNNYWEIAFNPFMPSDDL